MKFLGNIDTSSLSDQEYSGSYYVPVSNAGELQLDRLLGYGLQNICQGRLSADGTSPYPSSIDLLTTGGIFFVPFQGNRISLYDGTRWKLYTFTLRTCTLSGLTNNALYDVFAYDNAGTVTLELSAAWNSNTARFSSGTYAVTLPDQDGVPVKSTNGTTVDPTRRYLGTFRATGTNSVTDYVAQRSVFNAYNQVTMRAYKSDYTSHAYNVASGRQWRAQTDNKYEVVIGLPTYLTMSINGGLRGSAAANFAGLYQMLNGTTGVGVAEYGHYIASYTGQYTMAGVTASVYLAPGYHYVAAMQYANTTATNTFDGFNMNGTWLG